PDGSGDDDESDAVRLWEFHDLLFHSRSRLGRHDYPFGAVFPHAGSIDPLPAVKAPMSAERIALARPDLAQLIARDDPFTRVLESRRSIRTFGLLPPTLAQLGEFLYRAARVRTLR